MDLRPTRIEKLSSIILRNLSDRFKGALLVLRNLLAALPPFGPVLNDPVSQCPLKADVIADFLGFDPLMLQNLLTFRLELAI